jgi:hypothetical protein
VRSLAVGPHDVVLVHAGSGSVGQAVIQFAVLAARRCSARRATAAQSACEASARRRCRTAPVSSTACANSPAGVTVAIDLVGTDEALEQSIALVADRSRIATLVRGADAAGLGIRAFRGGSPTPLTATEERWRAEAIPLAIALMTVDRFSVEVAQAAARRRRRSASTRRSRCRRQGRADPRRRGGASQLAAMRSR